MIKSWIRRLRDLRDRALQQPKLLAMLFTVVLIIMGAALTHSALRKGGLWKEGRFNDFKAYHQAALAALDGDLDSAYHAAEKPYQYPPTLATIILPLGLLPYRVALVVWVLGSLLLLFWSFRILDQVLGVPVKGIDKFLGFLLVFRMIESDFANTNANVVVFTIVLTGFLLERRGRSASGGFTIALAACIKVAPLALLPWMLYRGRWRMTSGFVVGLILWGALIPGTILGPEAFSRGMKTWYRGLIAPLDVTADEYAMEAPGGYLPGQSPRVLLHRLLRPIDATAHDQGKIVHVNVLELPKKVVDWISSALSLLLLGWLLVFFWRRGHGRGWGGAEIALAILLTVLLSPLARKAHFVAMLPAATYACMLARIASPPRRRLYWILCGLAAALVIGTAPDLIGDTTSAYMLAFCPLSIAGALLLAIPVMQGWRMVPKREGKKGPV